MFWEEECMKAIGNRISKFMALEPNWETKVDCRCTRILVELDLKEGLYEEILINMHGSQWKQHLDYWKIPFQCYVYREVGHLLRNLPNNKIRSQFQKV